MKIVHALQAPVAPDPHDVSARVLHNTEHVQVSMITLKPGEALKRHVTPVDVFFYIIDGEGFVEIGDGQEAVSADMLIDSPARIPHRLFRESDGDFRFLVVKTPRPTRATKVL